MGIGTDGGGGWYVLSHSSFHLYPCKNVTIQNYYLGGSIAHPGPLVPIQCILANLLC